MNGPHTGPDNPLGGDFFSRGLKVLKHTREKKLYPVRFALVLFFDVQG